VDIGLEVKEACLNYQLADKSHDLYRKTLAAYEKDMEIKELQMKMGTITYSDYTTAQKELLEARIEAVEAGYDRELAYQKLLKVTGNLYPFDRRPVTEGGNK
jgi:outer membrane protein TolC